MTAIVFDTLKLARRLEGAGFSREQASGAAEALAEGLATDLATQRDVGELKAEIAAARTELKAEMAELRADLKTEIAPPRSDAARWIIGAVFVNTVTVIGAIAAVWQLGHR